MPPVPELYAGDEPEDLYTDDGDAGLYDKNSSEPQQNAYQPVAGEYMGIDGSSEYGADAVSAPDMSAVKQRLERREKYDNKMVESAEGYDAVLPESYGYDVDGLEPVEIDAEALLEAYDDEVTERMEEYGLDPEEGWAPLLEPEAYESDVGVELDDIEAELEDAYDEPVADQQYATAVSDDLRIEDADLYGRYMEDDDSQSYMEIAVVEQEMPDGLFGFTRPGQEKVAFVNKALYRVDKERTKLHEITHQEHPHWSEFMVRSRRTRGGGDIDPQHTLSYQANNPGRIGNGSGRIRPYDAQNYTDTAQDYA